MGFLDTIYIDKPVQRHNLIQTISRVNRKFENKQKGLVDDKAKYTDWSQRDDIKAELKVSLIILLANNDYPPVDRDEVYKEIFEQAQNFKKHQAA
jgi:type I site-specific restriction-modification system R (restriction) subunit|tara:strand:- start:154 stop:438 length:285 start_codon:yes stop_codon:yes gene_type:complete